MQRYAWGPRGTGATRAASAAWYTTYGMQHAAGAGLALAEWMLRGKSTTIAVEELGFERLLQQRPLRELAVIG